MTCDELKEQEIYLKSVIDALNQSIASEQTQVNLQLLQCLTNDTYGSPYPNLPVTAASIMARIQFLATVNPQPMALMNQYYALYQLLITISGQQATLAQNNAMLASVLQQEIDQGC